MQISKLILSLFAVSAVAAVAHAAPIPKDTDAVGLDMNLQIDGKTVSQPYALLLMGETGTVTQKVDEHTSYVMKTTPSLAKEDQVAMAFEISEVVDGKTTVLSTPKIISLNNETATMEVKPSKGETGHDIKLTVTPTL